jgi:predicted O-linked N-acetylglucosamine transferase (SPINDLY family)
MSARSDEGSDDVASIPEILTEALRLLNAGRFDDAEALCRKLAAAAPRNADAVFLLGAVAQRRGRLDDAVAFYRRAVALAPKYPDAHNNLGNVLLTQGKIDAAIESLRRAVVLEPGFVQAHYNLGNALAPRDAAEAAEAYRRAVAVEPGFFEAHNNLGVQLHRLAQPQAAMASFDRALEIKPDYAEALNNRGNVLKELKRLDEALASYERALAVLPDYAEALYNRGIALHEMKRLDAALASYDRALALRPDYAEALYNRGNTLKELRRPAEALASYDRALALRPDYAEALNNRGNVLHELKRDGEALASYDRALALRPDYAEALFNRGIALNELNRLDDALASYDRALALQPDDADALNNRGNTLKELDRLGEALASYERALAAKPDHPHALSGAADCAIKLCDWDRRTRFAVDLKAQVSGKKSIVDPFLLLGYSGDPALQLQCARTYIEDKIPLPPRPFWTGQIRRHDKIRIAYLSADFRAHIVAHVIAELLERHDRSRFEIVGVSFGVDDGSEIRKWLVATFDAFHDVRRQSDQDVAKLLFDLEIDIAIDLMGYTQDSRPGIFAYRPAPIQVNYLGYPGTRGTPSIDYIVADKIVAPFEHRQFYAERIVHLPDCFLVSQTQRKIAERAPTRQEAGLPEHGFVFCCFNAAWKLTPEIFDVWMRLLHRIEGSVLWLSRPNADAEANLRKAAQRRGIDSSRLVFAGRLPLDEHLARHRLADLFLDTLPYNAHSTAGDALWMGLPVLTCQGEAFAGRVAASLLHAVGLPELITSSREDYEALALKLARDPAWLAEIRTALARNRDAYPLFNTDRFARHIEAAYATMWDIWQRGEAPKSFSVEPI